MNRWAPWLLVAIAACLRPDSTTVERLARSGRVNRLASVIRDGRAAPEVRAQAASWLLTTGHAQLAVRSLGDLVEGRRGPVVAYLLHQFLPEVLERDPERGRRAILIVRPFGAPDSVARTDALLLRKLAEELDRGQTPGASRSALDLLRTVGPERRQALLPLVGRPGAPHGLLMELLSPDPVLLDRARARLAERVTAAGQPIDQLLWATLARWGPRRPLVDRLTAPGPEALAAARALAAAPPDPALADTALRLVSDRNTEPALRRALLGVLERTGSPAVVPRLLSIIRRETDPAVGYRTYLSAVLLGGPGVVVSALEAFPSRWRHSEPALSSYLVEGTLSLGPEGARTAARRAVRSRSTLARYTGIRLLERVGEPEDARLLVRLRRDRARVRGLEQGQSIGAQATRVRARLLQGQKVMPADGAAAGAPRAGMRHSGVAVAAARPPAPSSQAMRSVFRT